MNTTRFYLTKQVLNYVRLINNVQQIQRLVPSCYNSTFTLDAFTTEIFERRRLMIQRNDHTESSIQHCSNTDDKNVSDMSITDLDNIFLELLSKNKDKQIEKLVLQCQNYRKLLTYSTIKKLFRHYSLNGKPRMVAIIQNFCAIVDPYSYKRNGEFLHYLAKAQCIKGNSEKGLTILKDCYKRYESLRSFYRIIFRELIQDSVLNRSEASLVIFRKYVMEFSEEWSDHYPLVCFWHICWASTWFSDQMLGNELLEKSEILQDIVRDKATAFSIVALKDYNEDAVVRLLQTLLKYDMIEEYVAVLQVLFNYKCNCICMHGSIQVTEPTRLTLQLIQCNCKVSRVGSVTCILPFYLSNDNGMRNRDIRGCTEIIRNCDTLGVSLPSDQQGRYIKMLIDDKKRWPRESRKTTLKDFKLKF